MERINAFFEKLKNFSFTLILREIKVGKFRISESDILAHSEALNFDCYEIWHFFKTEIYQIDKIQSP